jgi:polysaccharide transporter, PST family
MSEGAPPEQSPVRRVLTALRHPISQNAIAIYVVQFAVSVLPLVTLPWIARQLGPDELGRVVFAQSFSWILQLAIEFGFGASATRAVARNRDDPEELPRVVAAVQGAKAGLSGVVLLMAAVSYFAVPILHDHPDYLLLALATALLQGFNPGWYFVGVEQLKLVSWLEVVNRVTASVLTIVLVQGPGDGWIVLALWLVGTTFVTIVSLYLMYRRIPFLRTTTARVRWAMSESWRLFIGGTAVTLYTTANTFFLGVLSTTVQAAYYSTAEKLVRAAPRLYAPVLTVVFPRIGNLLARNEEERAKRLTRLALVLLIGGSSVCALILFAGAAPIIHALYGHEFDPAINVLRVLALTLPLSAAAAGISQLELIARGLDRESVLVVIAAAVVDLAFGLYLTYHHGAIGTASTLVAVEFTALAAALYFGRRVRHTSRTVASSGK